ncbi:hypothetical protein ERO13_A09G083600v2 [Gossypium hirsutum]|uniref:Thionin-like protein 2 n=6 Tax=Gossypium TaxID=3633 RepID=A0ABR0NQ01_GOSAR|nr:thionin-like protein 2 [Gossypium hirsutum]XP_017610723.1 thionin-like protein 2 [Gossypium arboreum]KAB2065411.1 hypothetical protein ES319_A09G087100v1 [Gossypium barbadense]TYH02020.1 hypothetical protein ES288_A09G105600v1 [Gossypium darwinii]TYI09878.1 hypothetical protein ES332_A09G101400v1 [Gossypium tomentosum]TYJ17988.1 hypothetical protein E1A91_A09G091000v1 [Gossypium mustelinum]KAG4183038.1 hypothetical protein ERO13_A09G083600v2 [Gossypium hirsutum]
MEKSRVSVVVMICLVVGVLLIEPTAADFNAIVFGVCYGPCYVLCRIRPGTSNITCALKCLTSCIIKKSNTVGTVGDTQSFCHLGCASAMCSNLSSDNDPATKAVESCVGGCSETCAKRS